MVLMVMPGLHSIKHHIRSAANDRLATIRLRAHSAQVGMLPARFDNCHNAGGEPGGSHRLVPGDLNPNLLQPRSCQRRPDDLPHTASSSWALLQTQFGGGSSRSVPQESSQAFMSSRRT
jgi:hypothetical protein